MEVSRDPFHQLDPPLIEVQLPLQPAYLRRKRSAAAVSASIVSPMRSRASLLLGLRRGRHQARRVGALIARIGSRSTARLRLVRFRERRLRHNRQLGELDRADVTSHILRADDPALVRGDRRQGVDSEPGEVLFALEHVPERLEAAVGRRDPVHHRAARQWVAGLADAAVITQLSEHRAVRVDDVGPGAQAARRVGDEVEAERPRGRHPAVRARSAGASPPVGQPSPGR